MKRLILALRDLSAKFGPRRHRLTLIVRIYSPRALLCRYDPSVHELAPADRRNVYSCSID